MKLPSWDMLVTISRMSLRNNYYYSLLNVRFRSLLGPRWLLLIYIVIHLPAFWDSPAWLPPQQLETTLKVRFFWDSTKNCTVYDFFQPFAIVKFPYAMTMTLVRCSICVLFIRGFFTRTFSKLSHAGTVHFYGTLMKHLASLLTPTFRLLLTSFDCRNVAAGVFRIATISGVEFHSDMTYTAVNGEIWAIAEDSVAIVMPVVPYFVHSWRSWSQNGKLSGNTRREAMLLS